MLLRRSFLLTGFFLFCGVLAFSQLHKFQFPSNFRDLHTLYEYKKSNWDGTHASTIFLYVADSNKLESFKWFKGDKVATLVTAVTDWKIFSVKEFQNHKLRQGQTPQLVAQLQMESGIKMKIKVGEMQDSLILEELPWQSYDFDFAGLGFIWRALKNKNDSFYFHIADVAQKNGNMAFVNKGRVKVDFLGYETLNKKKCLKYFVNGEGLANKGGNIWIDPISFMIEQYKIALPDEPGFVNGMLQLVRTAKMSPEQWATFKKERLEE